MEVDRKCKAKLRIDADRREPAWNCTTQARHVVDRRELAWNCTTQAHLVVDRRELAWNCTTQARLVVDRRELVWKQNSYSDRNARSRSDEVKGPRVVPRSPVSMWNQLEVPGGSICFHSTSTLSATDRVTDRRGSGDRGIHARLPGCRDAALEGWKVEPKISGLSF